MRHPVSIALAASVLVACAGASPSPESAPDASHTQIAAGRPMIARVSALASSGTLLNGTVRLVPRTKPAEYQATVELRGARLGNQIPWSISTGQCGEPSSAEVGGRVQYRMIEAGADGTARLSVMLRLPLTETGTYHVDFFAGPTDRERVVACGPLVPE